MLTEHAADRPAPRRKSFRSFAGAAARLRRLYRAFIARTLTFRPVRSGPDVPAAGRWARFTRVGSYSPIPGSISQAVSAEAGSGTMRAYDGGVTAPGHDRSGAAKMRPVAG